MKRGIIFASLLIILMMPLASASVFDFLTGNAAEDTPATSITEQIKCIFPDSSEIQKCYTDDGKFSCSGIGSCVADVSGVSGTQLTWISSCSMKYPTIIDGTNEELKFPCPIPATTSASGGGGTSTTSTTTTQPTPITTEPALMTKEQVKCLFYESSSAQKCYSDDGKFGCSGIGSCVADVFGVSGTQLTWKSSCGNYAYTIIDGNNDYAEFKCPEQQATTTTIIQPLSTLVVKEQIKCLFTNSEKEQTCYSNEFRCSGIGSCVADVFGENLYGKQLEWKSSCGGYAYSIADNNNEYAEFKCGEAIIEPQPVVVQPPAKKQALIYVFLEEGCKQCDNIRDFIDSMKKKYGYVNANFVLITPSSQQTYTIIVAVYIKKGVPVIFLNDKVWNGFNDDIAKELEAEVKKCVENGCPANPNPPIPDEIKMYMTSTSTVAQPKLSSLTAVAQAPVQEGYAKEQIRCIFKNSDVLLNPHTALHEKCMTEDGQFGCIWDGNVEVLENGERKAYCVVMNVDGQKGKKLTWKSSCGGYSYNVIDGQNEDVEFSCIPATEVTPEQISGKGFLYAYWQCYDNTNFKQDSANCKTSNVWQQEAEGFCKDKCNEDNSKCGVNSFAVSKDCYLEAGKEGVVFMPAEEIKEATPIKEALICKDSCPFDNKCYPFGYRKADRFCSDNNVFVSQLKSEEKCDNNFECKSNLCLAGNCISENLINKIVNWFKKLFKASEKAEIIDCGTSSDCMESAFKECKPAKISQSDSVSEIKGLKGDYCILEIENNDISMTCKIENYEQGTKNLGDMSKYCEGDLVKYLSSSTTAVQIPETEKPELQSETTEEPTQTETLSVCEKIRNPAFKYECMAMLKKDPSDCELISEEVTRPYCYADVALAAGNSAICKSIADSGHKSACEALVEKNAGKCTSWIYADYCYRDVAALTGNTAACDRIAYSGGKADCNAVVLQDVRFCEDADSEDCYQKLALLTGDEKVCDELKKRESTMGQRPFGVANLDELNAEVSKCRKMAKREISGCSPESGSGTDCDLIPAMAENPSLCDNLEVTYSPKDGCYFSSAIRLADLMPPQLIVLRN